MASQGPVPQSVAHVGSSTVHHPCRSPFTMSMPAKRSRKAAQQELARRSAEDRLRLDRAVVKHWLNADESVPGKIVQHLEALGYDTSLDNISKERAQPELNEHSSTRSKAQSERLERLKQTTHAAAKKEMEGDARDYVPDKYETIGCLSLALLISHILSAVEPMPREAVGEGLNDGHSEPKSANL